MNDLLDLVLTALWHAGIVCAVVLFSILIEMGAA
jgi:hypothetical protein